MLLTGYRNVVLELPDEEFHKTKVLKNVESALTQITHIHIFQPYLT